MLCFYLPQDDGVIICSRLAEEELLREAKIAAARAEVNGVLDWQKCPLLKTNKTFLHNTIVSTMRFNMKKKKVSNNKFKTKSSSKSLSTDSLKKTCSKK